MGRVQAEVMAAESRGLDGSLVLLPVGERADGSWAPIPLVLRPALSQALRPALRPALRHVTREAVGTRLLEAILEAFFCFYPCILCPVACILCPVACF